MEFGEKRWEERKVVGEMELDGRCFVTENCRFLCNVLAKARLIGVINKARTKIVTAME
jgi:Ran GTPase-activating protein (RanGAP) involved in mRNA processing and transport